MAKWVFLFTDMAYMKIVSFDHYHTRRLSNFIHPIQSQAFIPSVSPCSTMSPTFPAKLTTWLGDRKVLENV